MSEHFAKLFQNNSEADSVGRIEGNLPNWLMSEVNQVIYNGPVGIWDHPNQTANHWFDGLSILTSFIIDGPGKEVKMKKRCSISNSNILLSSYRNSFCQIIKVKLCLMTFDKFFCATEVLKFVYRAFDLCKWTSGEHQYLPKWRKYIPYARHYNPLLIRNRS